MQLLEGVTRERLDRDRNVLYVSVRRCAVTVISWISSALESVPAAPAAMA